jgi:hypothetical protein
MKTKKQVIEDNQDFKALINAVISRIGKEAIEDVNRSGADAGWSGFIYYTETHKFAIQYRKQIVTLLKYQAESMGEEVMTMVKSFGVFRNPGFDSQDETDFYNYMGGGKVEQGTLTNVMAWFALEEVCRMFED